MMKRTNQILVKQICCTTLALTLLGGGCTTRETSVLSLNFGTGSLGDAHEVSGARIRIGEIQDQRGHSTEPEIIGSREAAFGVSLGEVLIDRPITAILHDALEEGIVRHGHEIVEEGEEYAISAEVSVFKVGTDVTALYWDVYGEVKIDFLIEDASSNQTSTAEFLSRSEERTYTNPSVSIMQKALSAAIREVVDQFFSSEIDPLN